MIEEHGLERSSLDMLPKATKKRIKKEVAAKKNVPVIMDVDLGHLPPMMPLVVGSMAEAIQGISKELKEKAKGNKNVQYIGEVKNGK